MSTTQYFGAAEAQAARDLIGGTTIGDLRNDLLKQILVATANRTGGTSGVAWGAITGTLLAQTDLAAALALLVPLTQFTGGGTVATGGFTLTVPATGTAALLGTANVFTAAQTISVAGANSAPPLYLTGALNVAGTGTTTFPHIFHQPTGATAATTWSSGANAGTVFGANEATGFTGNFFDGKIAGVTIFKINGATGAASVFTYGGSNWEVYDSVGGTRRAYESLGVWYGMVGFATIPNGIGLLESYTGLRLRNTFTVGWSADSTFYGTNDLILGRKAAATLQLGADAAGVTNQMLTAASRITSDGVGANLTLAGGNGRGGAGGSLIFSTYTTAGAATIGTLTTRLTLDTNGLLTFADAVDMAFNTITGTKIGTTASQKLGFWGTTPITQPARIVGLMDNSGGMSGGGTIGPIGGAVDPTAAEIASTQNAIATLAQKINEIENFLSATAGGIGLTA